MTTQIAASLSTDPLTARAHVDSADGLGQPSTWKRALDATKERATEWKGGLESSIREKPIQSVLIAAAVGAVVGIIACRSSR